MVTEVADEFIDIHPVSIAPAVFVVTAPMVPDVDAAPLAVDVPLSSGLVVLTPVYLAIPAPFATELDNVQL
jgi:hypothetical protein